MPPFWQAYEAGFAENYSKKTPIEAIEFVVFDTETTGFDLKKDKLLSIGAVRVKNFQLLVADSLDILIAQPIDLQGKSIEIHGILPSQNQKGLSEKEAVERFLRFCKNSVLVGHHVGFDKSMIDQILKRMIGKKLKNKALDTLDLAMRVNPPGSFVKPGDYTLDRLSELYHLPLSDRHTAAGDAYITALLLMKLLVRLRKRGVHTLGDLMRVKF